jgi:hypothetical protein
MMFRNFGGAPICNRLKSFETLAHFSRFPALSRLQAGAPPPKWVRHHDQNFQQRETSAERVVMATT